jgi:hypothetical protein
MLDIIRSELLPSLRRLAQHPEVFVLSQPTTLPNKALNLNQTEELALTA